MSDSSIARTLLGDFFVGKRYWRQSFVWNASLCLYIWGISALSGKVSMAQSGLYLSCIIAEMMYSVKGGHQGGLGTITC